MHRNLYALPISENGRQACYYCMFSSVEGLTYSWSFIRGYDILSTGVCAAADLPVMLNALCEDLVGVQEGGSSVNWYTVTLH